ncbi:MAG: hypothetical protein EOO68_24665 [Moraxellaceae bacterium]|nr:MAG: hypothetical protein EOO68_24665 [Moraxellaceae bacterium]
MKNLGYDIIGDVHGCAFTLVKLLEKLGYRDFNGVYQHPGRKVLFVGDILDRGPHIREAITLVKAMVDAIGIDHVGMGTDTDLLSARIGSGTNRAWSGLTGGFFNAVVAEMLRQGFTPDEIVRVGGGNYCRVFGKATSVRA